MTPVLRTVRRLLLFTLMLLLVARVTHAETPALLLEALKKTGADADRWAFTETSTDTDKAGHTSGATIVRFDPSKPYAEQFTPLKIDGKPPTEKQRKEYQKRGEQRGRELASDAEPAGSDDESTQHIEFDGAGAVLDFEHTKVISDTGASITYEIPMRKEGRRSLPVEKFQLQIRVSRERRELEHASLRLLAPWRVKLVAKLERGQLNIDYTVVDPNLPAVLSCIHGDLAVSILFLKERGTFEQRRTEFVHVKPFEERFGVKIGPMKALPF